jgi:hypothetical protein
MVPSWGRGLARSARTGELGDGRSHVDGRFEVRKSSMTSYARHAREFTAPSKLAQATFWGCLVVEPYGFLRLPAPTMKAGNCTP